jgi:hypothetical protein
MNGMPSCDLGCQRQTADWTKFFRRHEAEVGPPFTLQSSTVNIADAPQDITLFNMPLATIDIPSHIDKYDKAVGAKTRNMIRKALRSEYYYADAQSRFYLDDLYKIRTSSAVRQGQSLPESYFKFPQIKGASIGRCEYHDESFFSIFKDEVIVAYCVVKFCGEIARVGDFIGHASHLKYGIMNLLVREVVRRVIEIKPWCRGLNYLYSASWPGVASFKRHAGFTPKTTAVTQGSSEVAAFIERMAVRRGVQDQRTLPR